MSFRVDSLPKRSNFFLLLFKRIEENTTEGNWKRELQVRGAGAHKNNDESFFRFFSILS